MIITQIDNKYFTNCEVVMLPTEDMDTNVLVCIKKDDEIKVGDIRFGNGFYSMDKYYSKQHLYIVSNDFASEGDYGINGYNEVVKILSISDNEVKTLRLIDNAITTGYYIPEKIIASTQKLKIYEEETIASASGFTLKTNGISLPQIPESFIKFFIENQGEINYVLVECINHIDSEKEIKLKLTDNKINIINERQEKQQSKIYSKNEVITLIKMFRTDLLVEVKKGIVSGFTEDWIKTHLK